MIVRDIKNSVFGRSFCWAMILIFSLSLMMPVSVGAQGVLSLPKPGAMVPLSEPYDPAIVMGINLYPDNPLKFDFIIDQGDSTLEGEALQQESNKLVKYFLASLTIPEDEMWVNLSPYEKNRIISEDFGHTQMGRDLLALDYMLKQLSSTLLHPDQQMGSAFWERVYQKSQQRFGTTDIPVNTFNKIWIVPEKAIIFEHAKGAFIVHSHLKVMLEEDYLALDANKDNTKHGLGDVNADELNIISGVSGDIVREILIPEIEKEINAGKTFANLRQIYHSMLLAAWYKNALKESMLGQVYVNQKKTAGVENADQEINQKIYEQYVVAFNEGVFNFVKEEVDPVTKEMIPRKYFSGGVELHGDQAMLSADDAADTPLVRERVIAVANRLKKSMQLTVGLNSTNLADDTNERLTFEEVSLPDSAVLANVRDLANEYNINESVVRGILANNFDGTDFAKRLLASVQLRNPQTRLTENDIRTFLQNEGVLEGDTLALDALQASVTIVEQFADNEGEATRYTIDGEEYSTIVLSAIETQGFSRQLLRVLEAKPEEAVRQLTEQGYLSRVSDNVDRYYAQLNEAERGRVNQMMEAEGLSRTNAVQWVLGEKEIDERQRVAIRSMDHSASAFVDPFEKMSSLGGLFNLAAILDSYSPELQAEFRAFSEKIGTLQSELQYFAKRDPITPEFNFFRIYDFETRWKRILQTIDEYMVEFQQAAQVADENQETNEVIVTNVAELTEKISRDLEGQIAFAQGNTAFNRQTVNVADTVREAIKQIVAKKNVVEGFVNLDIDIDAELSEVDVNPTWVGLILSNLVNNAYDELAKQVADGQREEFKAGDIQVRLAYDAQSQGLTLTVHDKAGGINETSSLLEPRFGRERIFEYGRTEGKESGTGVGLAEVFHITRLMGWELSLNPGKRVDDSSFFGAEFKIVMPFKSVQKDNAMLVESVDKIINQMDPETFRGTLEQRFRSGRVKRESQFAEWDALETDKKKALVAGVFVIRKIDGAWKLLLGQRGEAAKDKKGVFSAPVGSVDKSFDRDEIFENVQEIERLKALGLVNDNDFDREQQRESITTAAVRELYEETGIKIRSGDIAARINDFRGNHEGVLVNFMLYVDNSNSADVLGNGELVNYQWLPLQVILESTADEVGNNVEKYLQDTTPNTVIMRGLKTAGMKNLQTLLRESFSSLDDSMQKDNAVLGEDIESAPEKLGGIDLNPAIAKLQIDRTSPGLSIATGLQPTVNVRVDGFLPVIIHLTPIHNLPLLLGLE